MLTLEQCQAMSLEELRNSMTVKQKAFVDNFVIDWNASKAAREAKYSLKSSASIATENMQKPLIKVYIQKFLEINSLSPEQVKKMVADAAKGNVSNYMRPVTKKRQVPYEFPLTERILECEKKINRIKKYIERAQSKGLLTEDELSYEQSRIVMIQKNILELEIEVEEDPKAFEIRHREEEYESVELDLIKVINDKEGAKVKSFKWSEFGPVLEIQDPADAQKTMLKVQGQFIDRVESKNENTNLNANVDLEPGEAKRIYDEIKKTI